MSFPLFKYDGRSIVGLNSQQIKGVKSLVSKLESGEYNLIKNPCQCQNPQDAEVVVEKDMYGIPNRNILCSNCGLIRSEKILDEKSLSRYYDEDYKPINYNLGIKSSGDYYNFQKNRGKQFFDLIQAEGLLSQVQYIYDMGCGAGGVMHYFHEQGLNCAGNDYSEEYLSFGNKLGMDLRYGEMPDSFPEKNSIDLFILAHVYEHLNEPLSQLKEIFSRIKIGGLLLFEVPGIFAKIPAKSGYPGAYHQFAHVVNFYNEEYLKKLFTHPGLEIIYSDERCTFVIQKKAEVDRLNYPDNTSTYARVKRYLILNHKRYCSIFNPTFLKRGIKSLISR